MHPVQLPLACARARESSDRIALQRIIINPELPMFPAASSFQLGTISRVTAIDLPYNQQARTYRHRKYAARVAALLSSIARPKRDKLVIRRWTVSINANRRVSKRSNPFPLLPDSLPLSPAEERLVRSRDASHRFSIHCDEPDTRSGHPAARNAITPYEIGNANNAVVLHVVEYFEALREPWRMRRTPLRAPTARIHYKTSAIRMLGQGRMGGGG